MNILFLRSATKKSAILNLRFKLFKGLLIASITLLISCSQLPITQLPTDNYNERIRYLIIHFTTIDYQDSVRALTKGGVSAHYLMPERDDPSYPHQDLKTFQLVSEDKRAWHAGRSHWQGQNNLNDQSIGIELVYKSTCTKREIDKDATNDNLPINGLNIEAKADRICFYPDFDPEQIEQLVLLVQDIIKRNPEITPDRIIGHADITPNRRVDPGPKFPWHQLHRAGIGAWYEQEAVANFWQRFQKQQPSVQLIQAALKSYGYGVIETGVMDAQTINALTVFQMHFRPWQVNGKASPETMATLFALIEKYRKTRLKSLLERLEIEANLIPLEKEKTTFLGQFDGRFPVEKPSTRQLVNNRKIFKAYKGSGELIIHNKDAQSVELYINGKKLLISKSLGDDSITRIDLSKYTKTGYNTFRLENLFPEQSSLTVEVPFPRLVETKKLQNQFSKEKLKKIDQLIESEIQQGFPGATLLIAKEGKIIKHTAYGYSNRYDREGVPLASPTEMTLDTLFDMASNTKMYATNYAVMKLVSEGKLNVNLPIGEYLVDYKGEGRESRLVSDLLNHTAGYIPVVNFHDKENNLGKHLFSQSKGHTQKLLIEKVPFKHSRGLKTVYSDVDYMLLGTLIERITQQSLDQYLSENIYLPLELEKTTFNPLLNGFSKSEIAATELQGNTRQSTVDFVNTRTDVVHGEVHDEKAFYSMQGVAGHAGLFSTAKDTAVLASVILNRGGYGKHRFFESSEMDQFLKPSNLNVTMGLGWRRAGNGERIWHFGPYASPYAIGHTGWTGTVTVIDPFHDLIIVLLTNKKHTTMKPEMVDGISTDNLIFAGDEFETGKYGSIISLVYEAFLEK